MYGTLATICEIIFLVCFGASWPFNIIKAYKARTTKGTSLQFMSLICLGYVAGLFKMIFTWIDKGRLDPTQWIAFACYIINLAMVSSGIAIYFRNKKLDAQKNKE
ncbi:MAG: hypothetical protein SO373_00780 [Candidatus Borkfalkiaceae bacterium]|nr:hypothetical protein [Christensenellaceae bacterium]